MQSNVSGRDLRSVVDEIRRRVERAVPLPGGYHVEYGGQFESEAQASRQLLWISAGIVVAIFFVLSGAFRSPRDGLLIMANLPLALIGGVAGVYLAGGVLSVASIVGFITRGRGLTVHARDCLTVAKSVLDRERLIDVEWDVQEPPKRPVRIAVYIGNDRPGLLSEITGAISSRNGNITKAEVTVTDDRKGINNFVVEVADLGQLQDIMGAIRDVRDVINVERVRGL